MSTLRTSRAGIGAAPDRIPVAVLGATGLVGQHLVRLLDRHPWFRLAEVVASDGRAGARYADAVPWAAGGDVPASARDLRLLAPGGELRSRVVLSALPADVARTLEPELARGGHRISSNASALRMKPHVPLIVPEVNPGAVDLVARQPWAAAGGAVVTNPNCVVAGLAPVLAPLDERFGVASAVVVTLQARSGAGLAGLDGPDADAMSANVIPNIEGEEEKIAAEVVKILGRAFPLDVAVNRVPVVDGHLAHVFLRLEEPASAEDIANKLRQPPEAAESTLTTAARATVTRERTRGLPLLPAHPIHVTDDPFRPQPRVDVDADGGMGVTVGRIRSTAGHDVALTLLVHNLVRGAAGACLVNAALMVAAHSTAPGA